MFFIHKYTDGAMVKFIKTPQVRHKNTPGLGGIKIGSYIRFVRGRIGKVKKIEKREIDTTKYPDSPRTNIVWFFTCRLLDNNEIMEIQPHVSMTRVIVSRFDLIFYKAYKLFIILR